jgi:hypothetical protein
VIVKMRRPYAGVGAQISGPLYKTLRANPSICDRFGPSENCQLMPSAELSRRVEKVVGYSRSLTASSACTMSSYICTRTALPSRIA